MPVYPVSYPVRKAASRDCCNLSEPEALKYDERLSKRAKVAGARRNKAAIIAVAAPRKNRLCRRTETVL